MKSATSSSYHPASSIAVVALFFLGLWILLDDSPSSDRSSEGGEGKRNGKSQAGGLEELLLPSPSQDDEGAGTTPTTRGRRNITEAGSTSPASKSDLVFSATALDAEEFSIPPELAALGFDAHGRPTSRHSELSKFIKSQDIHHSALGKLDITLATKNFILDGRVVHGPYAPHLATQKEDTTRRTWFRRGSRCSNNSYCHIGNGCIADPLGVCFKAPFDMNGDNIHDGNKKEGGRGGGIFNSPPAFKTRTQPRGGTRKKELVCSWMPNEADPLPELDFQKNNKKENLTSASSKSQQESRENTIRAFKHFSGIFFDRWYDWQSLIKPVTGGPGSFTMSGEHEGRDSIYKIKNFCLKAAGERLQGFSPRMKKYEGGHDLSYHEGAAGPYGWFMNRFLSQPDNLQEEPTWYIDRKLALMPMMLDSHPSFAMSRASALAPNLESGFPRNESDPMQFGKTEFTRHPDAARDDVTTAFVHMYRWPKEGEQWGQWSLETNSFLGTSFGQMLTYATTTHFTIFDRMQDAVASYVDRRAKMGLPPLSTSRSGSNINEYDALWQLLNTPICFKEAVVYQSCLMPDCVSRRPTARDSNSMWGYRHPRTQRLISRRFRRCSGVAEFPHAASSTNFNFVPAGSALPGVTDLDLNNNIDPGKGPDAAVTPSHGRVPMGAPTVLYAYRSWGTKSILGKTTLVAQLYLWLQKITRTKKRTLFTDGKEEEHHLHEELAGSRLIVREMTLLNLPQTVALYSAADIVLATYSSGFIFGFLAKPGSVGIEVAWTNMALAPLTNTGLDRSNTTDYGTMWAAGGGHQYGLCWSPAIGRIPGKELAVPLAGLGVAIRNVLHLRNLNNSLLHGSRARFEHVRGSHELNQRQLEYFERQANLDSQGLLFRREIRTSLPEHLAIGKGASRLIQYYAAAKSIAPLFTPLKEALSPDQRRLLLIFECSTSVQSLVRLELAMLRRIINRRSTLLVLFDRPCPHIDLWSILTDLKSNTEPPAKPGNDGETLSAGSFPGMAGEREEGAPGTAGSTRIREIDSSKYLEEVHLATNGDDSKGPKATDLIDLVLVDRAAMFAGDIRTHLPTSRSTTPIDASMPRSTSSIWCVDSAEGHRFYFSPGNVVWLGKEE